MALPSPDSVFPLTSTLNSSSGAIAAASFARASVAYYPDDRGIYQQYSSGTAGFNSNGIFVEPARTNYCTNYNANPDAALTGVSVTSGLIQRVYDPNLISDSGLQNICTSGYVFRYGNITASAQTITIAGATGSAASYVALSLFGYSENAVCTLQITGGVGAVPIPLGSSLDRVYSDAVTTVNTTDTVQIVVPAGAVVTWVLNQLEWNSAQSTNAASTTSPIVTSGASATRAATTVSINLANLSFSNPTTNYAVYLETYGARSAQSVQSVIFSMVGASSTRSNLVGSGQFGKRDESGASNIIKESVFTLQESTAKLFYFNAGNNAQVSINGIGTRSGTAITTAMTMNYSSGAFLYLGYSSTGVTYNYFQGQIKNVEIYKSAVDATDANTKTALTPITDLGAYGYVLYDAQVEGRIWALGGSGSSFTTVNYSDNYGSSWTVYKTLTTPATHPTLNRDVAGNCYYGVGGSLYRLANSGTATVPVAGAEANVVAWTPNGAGQTYSYLPWAWAEDGLGNIYTAGYMAAQNGQDGCVIQKSSDAGVTWSAISLAATFPKGATYSHVHALRYDKYRGRLYVASGDDAVAARGVAYSTNAGSSWTIVTDSLNPGPTAMSFSPESGYEFSDNVGSANAVNYIGSTAMSRCFSIPQSYANSPLYMGSLRGSNEMWALSWPESYASGTGKFNVISKFTKPDGATSKWSLEKAFTYFDPELDSSALYTIGHDGTASIPEWARYIFCTKSSNAGVHQGLYRFSTESTYNSSGLGTGSGSSSAILGRGILG